jgi:hypothetical protein
MASSQQVRSHLRRLALLASIGAAVMSSGCQSWHVAPAGVRVAAEGSVGLLRLTLLDDSSRIYLSGARLVGDSLVGSTVTRGGTLIPCSVPIARVRKVEVPRAGPAIGVLGLILLLPVITMPLWWSPFG